MKSQSGRDVFFDVCADLFGRVASPKRLVMSLVATSLIVFSFPPVAGQGRSDLADTPESRFEDKASVTAQAVSGTAYVEDGYMILEGATIYVQKTNPSRVNPISS